MILHNKSLKYCIKCNKLYTITEYEWCKLCQKNYLKGILTNWTSGNEKIDNFIKEKQIKIDHLNDIVFEWIPYNKFNNIKEIDKGGFATVYSAIWKDGPLNCDKYEKYTRRQQNQIVVLKCLYNSQDITNDFLNEVISLQI
jgi:hypothetical protein